MTKGKQLAGRKVPQTSTLFVLSRSFPPCCSLLARLNSNWLFLQKIVVIHRFFLGDCASSHFVSPRFNWNQCHTSISDWNLFPIAIDSKRWSTKNFFCHLGISPLCVQHTQWQWMPYGHEFNSIEIKLENCKKKHSSHNYQSRKIGTLSPDTQCTATN